MKSLLSKVVMVGGLTLLAMPSVFAAQCQAHNARGDIFVSGGMSRADATANVMAKCSRNSVYARNCRIDWCRAGQWECDAHNARGQQFVGTGPTRAIAVSNVMGYCAANSAYARNCQISTCFPR
jgi:hypothetical protein